VSDVYLWETDVESIGSEEITEKLETFLEDFSKDKKLALKMHFGERKSDTHLKPEWVEPIYKAAEKRAKEAVLMDCTVLYNSPRALASSHKEVARDNGFDFAPIVIADGEKGMKELKVEIDGEIFNRVRLGEALEDYDCMLAVTHFTGHIGSGFGGALKNIGMGLGSKAGKVEMHEAFDLNIKARECVACGECIENCPEDAISLSSGRTSLSSERAVIDHEECIGCGSCIGVCPEGAVKIPWTSSSRKELQKRIAEYAKGVVKNRNMFFVNFVLNVTKKCDCIDKKQEPFVEDVGVLFSKDPVAIDQASLDLIGKSKFMIGEIMINPDIQLKHGEKIGLGNRNYKIKYMENK